MEKKYRKPEIKKRRNIFFVEYCDDVEFPKRFNAADKEYIIINRKSIVSALRKAREKYEHNILPFLYDGRENYLIGNCLVKFGRAFSPNYVDIESGVDLFSDSGASLEMIIKDLGLPLAV